MGSYRLTKLFPFRKRLARDSPSRVEGQFPGSEISEGKPLPRSGPTIWKNWIWIGLTTFSSDWYPTFLPMLSDSYQVNAFLPRQFLLELSATSNSRDETEPYPNPIKSTNCRRKCPRDFSSFLPKPWFSFLIKMIIRLIQWSPAAASFLRSVTSTDSFIRLAFFFLNSQPELILPSSLSYSS